MPTNKIDKERLVEIANAVEKRPSLMSQMFEGPKPTGSIYCSCEKQRAHNGGKVVLSGEEGTCAYCYKLVDDS